MGIIKNIKSLQGMGIYADRGARSPSLQFRRYNLVYGFNGSGKSTLSRLFASLEAGGPHPKLPAGGTFEVELDDGTAFECPINPVGLEQRLLVFNSDYIEQNLQWAAGRANPVFYIGADQAEAANELTKVEGDIIQADAKRDTASATEKAAEKTFANYKRERAKSVASRLHLGSRKYEAPALAKDYETWKDDDRPALTDDELKAAEDTRRLDEPMPRLEPMSFDKTTIETAYRFIADVCGQSLATVALEEVQQYGKAGLRAEGLDAIEYLGRLYLHTVEFGLVREGDGLRGFGAGMLSSYTETVHAVTAPGVRRLRFDLPRVMRSEYLFDQFQKTYFVIDSFEYLLKAAEETDFAPIYMHLRNLPLLAPDADCPGDVAFVLALSHANG